MPGIPSKPNNIPLASSLPKVSFRRIPPEEALQLAAPAGVFDQQNVNFGFNDASEFVKPEHYLRYVEPIETDLKKQVEYDMDEQDQEWLDAINVERKREQLDTISYETFEIIIDQLEKEWFDLMKRVPQKPHHAPGDDQDDDLEDGEDTKCAICDDGECENSNAIVFCDGCNLAVHQDCYGIPYIPEGQWLCRKCTVSPDRAVSCILCPHEGGAFKQTTAGKWAHLFCAMWIPETGVSNPVYMEPIDSVDRIPKARWKLQCYLCRYKMGACIQCNNKFCFTAFHATCARKAGLLIKSERQRVSHHNEHGDAEDEGGITMLRACCHKHMPKNMRDQLKIPFGRPAAPAEEDSEGSMRGSPFATPRTREHSVESGLGIPLISVSRRTSLQGSDKNPASKSARAYKKSYKAGPPLVPTFIIDRVLEYIAKVGLRKKQPFVLQVARFWSLKREARRGAPLLKRLHLEPWTASGQNKEQTDSQKMKKLEFLKTLRYDLEKIRMLAELVRKREKEKLRQIQLIRDVLVDAVLFPFHEDLKHALAKLEAMDRQGFFSVPVSRAEVPDYYDIIKEPMDWLTMKEKLGEKAYVSVQEFKEDVVRVVTNAMVYNKPDTPFHRAASKIQKQIPAIFNDLERIEKTHLNAFQDKLKKQAAAEEEEGEQQTEAAPLSDNVLTQLETLRLESPIGLVKLLGEYDGMELQELTEIRGAQAQLDRFLSSSNDSTPQDSSEPTRQPTPVHNVVEDLVRQFYLPDPPSGSKSKARLRRKRQDSEGSNASNTSERRVSRRLKGDSLEHEVEPEQTPKPRRGRASARRASAENAAVGDTTTLPAPSVSTIPEESQMDTEGGRASRSRATKRKAGKLSNGTAEENKQEVEKKARLKRGQILDEPTTLQVEQVGDRDSFKRFNLGWVLPEGSKRAGRAQPSTPNEPSPFKRPRKASEPHKSATATRVDEVKVAQATASPSRPRSKTHPLKAVAKNGNREGTPESKANAITSLRAIKLGHSRNDSTLSELPEPEPSNEAATVAEEEAFTTARSLCRRSTATAEPIPEPSTHAPDAEARKKAKQAEYNALRREKRAKTAARKVKDSSSRPSRQKSPAPTEDVTEPGTLVWAKMWGYPFFPAEVFDETDTDNIPPSVLEDKAQASPTPDGETLALVRFFDKSTSWVWTPHTKLRLMFEDTLLDDEMLKIKEKKHVKQRKNVREAFEKAKAQLA